MTTTTFRENGRDSKNVISYDNGINPFKNYDINFRMIMSEMVYMTLSDNNLKQQDVYFDNSSQLAGRVIYENTYDKNNYPTTIIGKRSDNKQVILSYKFEYN